MTERFSAFWALASLTLVSGCDPAMVAPVDGGTGDASAEIDAGREPVPPSCELWQAPQHQPVRASTALVTAESIYLGDARGLWRSTGLTERFEPVSLPGAASWRGVVQLLETADGAIFAVLGDERILRSDDDGAHWEALAPVPNDDGSWRRPRLATDGERVVVLAHDAVTGASLHDLDRESGAWTEVLAEPPIEGWGHGGFRLVGLDHDALFAAPEGYRQGGLYRLDRSAPRWVHVEGLDAFGYTSFVRGERTAIVGSPQGIWAEVDGAFVHVLDGELGGPILVSTSDGFLGLDRAGLLRSIDGVTWTIEPFSEGERLPASGLSERGGRVAILRGEGEGEHEVRLAALDTAGSGAARATRWETPSIISQRFEEVSLHGEGDAHITYVSPYTTWGSYGVAARADDAWTEVTWSLPSAVSTVAMSETGLWACAYSGCVHRSDDGEVGRLIAMPEMPYAFEPSTAFATLHGLFVSARPYGTPTGVVQPGLMVLRDAWSGTWEDASAGLRSWSNPFTGAPHVATVTALFELDGVMWATQSQRYLPMPFTSVVLRSDDVGSSWTVMREGVELTALVSADAGVFGIFEAGTFESGTGEAGDRTTVIEAMNDDRTTFAPIATQPGAVIVDLVALDGRLVAATDSGLFTSDDGGASWATLAAHPRLDSIADLDASSGDSSVLAIASRTSGLWEATGCFGP